MQSHSLANMAYLNRNTSKLTVVSSHSAFIAPKMNTNIPFFHWLSAATEWSFGDDAVRGGGLGSTTEVFESNPAVTYR